VVPFLEKYIPVEPAIVEEYMPGAISEENQKTIRELPAIPGPLRFSTNLPVPVRCRRANDKRYIRREDSDDR
jgi:hypothetical protein